MRLPKAVPVERGESTANAGAGRDQRRVDAQERQQRAEQEKPLKREIARIDERLSAIGKEKAVLEQRLAERLPAAEIAETGKRLKALAGEIEGLEERWLALSDQLETLTA